MTTAGRPRVLGIVPARSGSKGLPRKNLRNLLGKPLLGWAAEALVGSNRVHRAICSTDSEEIADVARGFGLEVPSLRPAELSDDTALIGDVVVSVIRELESIGDKYDYVVLAQPTSPTVSVPIVNEACDLLTTGTYSSVVSVSRFPPHVSPFWSFQLGRDGTISAAFPDFVNYRRQDLPAAYRRAGLFYGVSVSQVAAHRSLFCEPVGAFEVPDHLAITIDTEEDLLVAGQILLECLQKRDDH